MRGWCFSTVDLMFFFSSIKKVKTRIKPLGRFYSHSACLSRNWLLHWEVFDVHTRARNEAKRFSECHLGKISSIFFIDFLSFYLVKRRIYYSLDGFFSCLLHKIQFLAYLWSEEFDYLDVMFIFKFKKDDEDVQKIISKMFSNNEDPN